MASQNKKQKTDKKKHFGRGGSFLKYKGKLKGVAFFNSSKRSELKSDLDKHTEEGIQDQMP